MQEWVFVLSIFSDSYFVSRDHFKTLQRFVMKRRLNN